MAPRRTFLVHFVMVSSFCCFTPLWPTRATRGSTGRMKAAAPRDDLSLDELLKMLAETRVSPVQKKMATCLIKAKTQLLAAEKARSEAEKARSEAEKAQLSATYRFENAQKDLLSVRGDLTARRLLERWTGQIRKDMNLSYGSTKGILRYIDKYEFNSSAAREMKSAFVKCNNMTSDEKCGQFFENLFSSLSDRIHQVPWNGPAIRVSARLGEVQKCVIANLAEKEGLQLTVDMFEGFTDDEEDVEVSASIDSVEQLQSKEGGSD
mmetsp:Transcript_28196/g.52912  ORF Transcript_28196/g.52912 Transcript_28196/m.52912 type:complete len:265 (+) Transcript_28196:73-867(+)